MQREYGISMQTVLLRAKQVGVISERTYLSQQKLLSKLGLRKDEEYFIEVCKKIFFNYTDDLIGYLKAENYEEIVPAYYVFNKY